MFQSVDTHTDGKLKSGFTAVPLGLLSVFVRFQFQLRIHDGS